MKQHTIDLNIPTHEISFNKLYLFNLLTKQHFSTYYEAEKSNTVIPSIIKKLRPYEVKLMIDLISDLM